MAALQDGYRTLISMALDPNISLWEKRVKPHGYDGGGGISTDTMRNDSLRTMHPKSLLKITDMTINAAWNPTVYTEVFLIILRIQLITTTFPDGSQLKVYSWVDAFDPAELVDGEQPMASFKIIAANTNNLAETELIFVPAA